MGLDFFYVSLPAGSTVAALRAELEGLLEPGVALFEPTDWNMEKLEDDAPLPSEVIVRELRRPISADMILTKRQCQEAQAALEASLTKAETQKQFDEYEKNANGNDIKYRVMLTKTLASEVYPDVLDRFGLPTTPKGITSLTGSIAARADLSMLETWLRLETLMRNKAAMANAQKTLEAVKMSKAMGA